MGLSTLGRRSLLCTFSSVRSWLQHGDDVYNRLLKTIPPNFAMRSEWWISTYQWTGSEYRRTVARDYDDYLWWCLLLGSSDEFNLDVRSLYNFGLLDDLLKNIHINNNYAGREGAPSPVPPLYDSDLVDALVDWVAMKLE